MVGPSRLAAALLALLSPLLAGAAPPTLELSPVVLQDDSEIHFEVSRPKLVGELPFELEQASVLSTLSPSFELLTELRQFQQSEVVGYRFWMFLQSRTPGGPVYGFRVQARPIGSFQDSLQPVEFIVRQDGVPDERGQITLPVYANSPPAFLGIAGQDEAFEVHPGAVGRHTIRLSNQLQDLPVAVHLEPNVGREQDWWLDLGIEGADGASVPDPLNLSSGSDTEIRVKAQPSLLHGFLEAILPSDASNPQDRLVVTLRYGSTGGRKRTELVTLPVVFVPGWWALGLALLLGVTLGTVLLQLFGKLGRRKHGFLRSLLRALALAAAVWIVALGLYAANSRLQLFGIEIHPLQLLSTLILGLAAGLLGPRGFALLEKRIGGAQPAAAGGAAKGGSP